MKRAKPKPIEMTRAAARRVWLKAQRLDVPAPFGAGPEATQAAVEQLGYVQIDTINVIERSHHHILWTRIPEYRRDDLHHALSVDRSVFEYWTHALAYVPTRDLRYFLPAMQRHRATSAGWFASVSPMDVRKVVARIRKHGPLSIRDIDDDELVDKDHPWASRKPSKRALQKAFFEGRLTVSARDGMVKTYELAERHFGWEARPRPASERQIVDYMLDRALRAQGVVSLRSICLLGAGGLRKAIAERIEARLRRRLLVPVALEGAERQEHWMARDAVEALSGECGDAVHLLSPFDPLVIQRDRLALFFGYVHRFEAYVPREKRRLGYFALPVLVGDRIAAAIDCKADRSAGALLIRQWTWLDGGGPADKPRIEAALERFERFQLGA
jgi:uncharacterized protein